MASSSPATSVLVTGATSGLGFCAAAALLRDDPWSHVIVASRDAQRGQEAADRLGASVQPRRVSVLALDLASLTSIRSGVAGLHSKLESGELPPLRGLVANAAVQLSDARQRTADGFEATFGTNVLGHFLLIALLLGDLAADARIVLVSSGTHRGTFRGNLGMPGPQWRAPAALAQPDETPAGATRRAGQVAYTTSKLGAVYLAHALARRPETEAMAISCFDPGLMPATGLARDYSAVQRFVWKRVLPALRFLPGITSPRASGRRLARLITDPDLAGLGGEYVELDRVKPSSPASYDIARETELWDTAARLTRSP